MNSYKLAGSASIGFCLFVDAAYAGALPVPGPIAGVGLPALVLIAGAYWIARKILARRR